MGGEDVVNYIWENWKDNQGACRNCLARDSNTGWPLYFGEGSVDTELMLIGEDPGGREDPNYEDEEGYGRRDRRRYPEDRTETVDEHHPRKSKQNGTGPVDIGVISDDKIQPVFFENIDGYSGDVDDTEELPYYTNTKKFQEIKGIDFGPESGPVQRCLGYLSLEIDVIDPSVIVLFGGDAIRNFSTMIPLKRGSAMYEDIFDILRKKPGPPHVLISYHWSRGIPTSNLSVSGQKEYWERLGSEVNRALNL